MTDQQLIADIEAIPKWQRDGIVLADLFLTAVARTELFGTSRLEVAQAIIAREAEQCQDKKTTKFLWDVAIWLTEMYDGEPTETACTRRAAERNRVMTSTESVVDQSMLVDGTWLAVRDDQGGAFVCRGCGEQARQHPQTNCIWGCLKCGYTTAAVSSFFDPGRALYQGGN